MPASVERLGQAGRHVCAASCAAAARQRASQHGCQQLKVVSAFAPDACMICMMKFASHDPCSLLSHIYPACPSQVPYRGPLPGGNQARPTTCAPSRPCQFLLLVPSPSPRQEQEIGSRLTSARSEPTVSRAARATWWLRWLLPPRRSRARSYGTWSASGAPQGRTPSPSPQI